MKRIKPILIFCLVLLSVNVSFGQKNLLPNWIKGTWQNTFESDTNNFLYWTFKHDSIIIQKGYTNSETENLMKKYAGYEICSEHNDSICRIVFQKNKDIIEYEYKLNSTKIIPASQPYLTLKKTVGREVLQNHQPVVPLFKLKN